MTLSPISTLSTAAYNTASAAVNAVRNNPKTTAAVVLTAAGLAAAYYNADAVTSVAQQALKDLADYSPVVREYAEYLNLLSPVVKEVKEVVVEPTTLQSILAFTTSTITSATRADTIVKAASFN